MRFSVREINLFERDVRLRMPFRFGIVTLTQAPQAFARARIRLENGAEAEGGAAELLAPKWFDKNPDLSNEDNFDQLRSALSLAKGAYLASGANTAFGHFEANYRGQLERGADKGLNALVACFGPALIDRALLDALCRGSASPSTMQCGGTSWVLTYRARSLRRCGRPPTSRRGTPWVSSTPLPPSSIA